MSNNVQQTIAERTLCIIIEGEMLVEITLQAEADRPLRNACRISHGPISLYLKRYFHEQCPHDVSFHAIYSGFIQYIQTFILYI